jgi:hypothetical protein
MMMRKYGVLLRGGGLCDGVFCPALSHPQCEPGLLSARPIKCAMRTVGLILQAETRPTDSVSKISLATVPGIAGRNSTVESEVAKLMG